MTIFGIEKRHSPLTGKVLNKSEFYSHQSPSAQATALVAENILPAVRILVSIKPLSAPWASRGKGLAGSQINLPPSRLFMFTVPARAENQTVTVS